MSDLIAPVMATPFTPVTALLGGSVIGLSALILWACLGRVCGISGILSASLKSQRDSSQSDSAWQMYFVLGLILGPMLGMQLDLQYPQIPEFSPTVLIIAGLLVGVGTGLGNGCTSGHGICGNARLSKRSFVATLAFMASGMLVVLLMRSAFTSGLWG